MRMSKALTALSITAVLGTSSMSFAAPVTVFEDNFDSHADGTPISTVIPPTGNSYQLLSGGSTDNVVQNAVNNGGNALATTRADGAPPSWVNGFWDNTTGLLTGGYTYTITYDLYRANSESNTGFGIDVGYGPGQYNPTLLHGTGGTNNQLLYRDSAAGAYLDSGYTVGYGGWETYEIVLTMPANGGNPISGTYDVFLTRSDANNNEGLLPRTLIIDDASAYHNGVADAVALGRILYYTGPPASGSGNDSTIYIDNVSVVRNQIPEPASLALLGLGGLAGLTRRR